jgi:beta-aspartyl-dipeptidase (metallo-type)
VRVAADAHVAGMMSGKAGVLHLHLGDGARGLDLVRRAIAETELPASVFHPTHVNRRPELFEEARVLSGSGCTVDVTAFPVDPDDPGDRAIDAATAIASWLSDDLDPTRITCSSDGGGCMPVFDDDGRLTGMGVGAPGMLAETLRALLDRGLDLAGALPPFTSSVARVLRLERKGRIAAGADADLVVLGEDRAPRDVLARGRWPVRGGTPVVRGPFEVPAGATGGTR